MLFVSKKHFIFMLALGLCFTGKTLEAGFPKVDRQRKIAGAPKADKEGRTYTVSFSKALRTYVAEIRNKEQQCEESFCVTVSKEKGKGHLKPRYFEVRDIDGSYVNCTQNQAKHFYKALRNFKRNIELQRSLYGDKHEACYYTTAGLMSEFKKIIGIRVFF